MITPCRGFLLLVESVVPQAGVVELISPYSLLVQTIDKVRALDIPAIDMTVYIDSAFCLIKEPYYIK